MNHVERKRNSKTPLSSRIACLDHLRPNLLLGTFVGFLASLAQPLEAKDVKPAHRTPGAISIIGHRGASGYRPEHTLQSYELAIEQGADYIEPDLVMTKDNVLIARHENEISETTDVAVKFPERKKTKSIDGKEVTGWFTEDFTLAEIKTLRAKERLPFRDQSFNGKFEVPTFDEVLALRERASKEKKRTIGVYPETKHPTYHASVGLKLAPAVVKALRARKLDQKTSPVIVQSFELGALKEIRAALPVKVVFLMADPHEVPPDFQASGDKRTYAYFATHEGLKELKKSVDGIGPYKRYIVPEGKNGVLLPATRLIEMAHDAGLVVHPYTFRSDERDLSKRYPAKEVNGSAAAEYKQFFALGVDGVFSDFPDHAVKAREQFFNEH